MLPRDVPYGGFMGRGGGGGGPYGGEGPVMSQQMRPPMVPGSMMGGMPGGMPMHGMMGPQQGMFMMGQPRAQSFMGGPAGPPAGPVTGRPSMPPGMQSGMPGPIVQPPPGIPLQQLQQKQKPQQVKASTGKNAPGSAHKYEDIKAKRRESQAALLQRQVAELELSPTLARPALYDQYQVLKQAAAAEGRGTEAALVRGIVDSSSTFAAIPGMQRCYMLEAASTAPEKVSMPHLPTNYNPGNALGFVMQCYMERMQRGRLLASKFGSVIIPAEFGAIFAAEESVAA